MTHKWQIFDNINTLEVETKPNLRDPIGVDENFISFYLIDLFILYVFIMR